MERGCDGWGGLGEGKEEKGKCGEGGGTKTEKSISHDHTLVIKLCKR